jgi:AcrR family transcriptional regulator
MRQDARRNHEVILSSAIAVLADSPQASMREIADASGIGRTTLYRHFPDREALVLAIDDHVQDEAEAIAAHHLTENAGADPVEVVAGLCAELAGLGDRYRFLEHNLPAKAAATESGRSRESEELLRRYLAAGQRAGTIRDDLDVGWLIQSLIAVVTQAAGHRFGDADARTRMVRATVTSLLAPPPRDAAAPSI